jgi:hypothetical protein
MILVAADADGAAILDANRHSTTDRTISAGSGYPVVWNLLLRSVAILGIFTIRILLGKNVQAELSLEVHAARS